MASIQVYRGADDPLHHTCGAARVFGLWYVTAAHCVTDVDTSTPMAADLFHVRVGSANRASGGALLNVVKILVNAIWAWPNTGPGIVGDTAMLKVDTYVQGLQPFEVAPKTSFGSDLRLLGWGITEPNGDLPPPELLQELDTRLLPPGSCPADYLIGADQLCVDNPNGTDGPCRGDSGGPATQKVPGSHPVRWAVVGGAFAGPHFCGTGPSLYTDWTYWRAWIFAVARTEVVPPRIDGGPGHGRPTGPPTAAIKTAVKTGVTGNHAQWHADCGQNRACGD